MSVALANIFAQCGGADPNSPALIETEPSPEFLKDFSSAQYTGANGSGPILNANAVLLPDRADQYRDTSNFNDFRLGNGLGISRYSRKPDSQPGQTTGGFQGVPYPSKMFGRDSKTHDLNWDRDVLRERADMSLKKMGYKPNEVPLGADFQPWDWNNLQALGIGSNGNQYNRNYALPDADMAARRLYEPSPSRKTKMITTDVENAALRPNRTAMNPVAVVSEDRQREKFQRISKNTDVIESVLYENIFPRGAGPSNLQQAPYIFADPSVLRIPVGNNETGDRSYIGIWRNGHDTTGGATTAASLEDYLQLYKDDQEFVRGKTPTREVKEFADSERYLNSRPVEDPNQIQPYNGEYPNNNQQGLNGPLISYPSAGLTI